MRPAEEDDHDGEQRGVERCGDRQQQKLEKRAQRLSISGPPAVRNPPARVSAPAPSAAENAFVSGARERLKFEKTRRRADSAWQKFETSTAGDVWDRLSSVDFMNQALLLAAVMLLWLFPNLIFLAAVTGRDFAQSVSSKMGLNAEATRSVDALFKSSSTSTAATVGAILFLVLAVTATVAVIQKIWQTIWGVEKGGYWKEVWQQVLWGFGALAIGAALTYIEHDVNKVHPALAGFISFVVLAAFFWLGMWLLLSGRVPFPQLVVPALVTSAFFLGLGAFSAAFLSDAIISNDKEYGPIGVVFILMTWLLSVGVVFILGPIVGVAIQERRRERRRERDTTA
jgi:membrane protein